MICQAARLRRRAVRETAATADRSRYDLRAASRVGATDVCRSTAPFVDPRHPVRVPGNLGIALAKITAAIDTKSGSLLAEAIEPYRLRHTRDAELMVFPGEEVAAPIGLTFACVFVSIAYLTGDTRFDASGSIAIAVVLIGVSILPVFRIRTRIVGPSVEPALERANRAHRRPEVRLKNSFPEFDWCCMEPAP